jgi:hypothetical protein
MRRFKKLAAAGLPEIDLHDVRHSYATAGRDAKIERPVISLSNSSGQYPAQRLRSIVC